jgi:hypothetical protein
MVCLEPQYRSTTKTRNSLGDKVKGALTEVKMSRRRKRSDLDQEKQIGSLRDVQSHRVGCGVRKNGHVSVNKCNSECDWLGRRTRTGGRDRSQPT